MFQCHHSSFIKDLMLMMIKQMVTYYKSPGKCCCQTVLMEAFEEDILDSSVSLWLNFCSNSLASTIALSFSAIWYATSNASPSVIIISLARSFKVLNKISFINNYTVVRFWSFTLLYVQIKKMKYCTILITIRFSYYFVNNISFIKMSKLSQIRHYLKKHKIWYIYWYSPASFFSLSLSNN